MQKLLESLPHPLSGGDSLGIIAVNVVANMLPSMLYKLWL